MGMSSVKRGTREVLTLGWHRGSALRIAAGSILLLLMLMPAAGATHEASHRYYVGGKLTREDGSPACGVAIQALDTRGVTDNTGQYRLLLHLHHPDSGEADDVGTVIDVRVEGTSLTAETTALTSLSADGWGESRVDFTVPNSLGGECTAPLLQVAYYVGIPALVVAGAVLAYFKVFKPWTVSRRTPLSLSDLPGIGKGREGELRSLGIQKLEDVAAADPAVLAEKTSIGRKEAKRLVRKAREILDRDRG